MLAAVALLAAAVLVVPVLAQAQPSPATPTPPGAPAGPWGGFGPWLLALLALAGGVLLLRAFWVKPRSIFQKRDREGASVPAGRPLSPALRAYLDWLSEEYSHLPPVALEARSLPLDLAAVHLPLRLVVRDITEAHGRRMRGEGAPDEHGDAGLSMVLPPLTDVLFTPARPDRPPQNLNRLLLLGDAGSGKTTTLRYAALRCAEAHRAGGKRGPGGEPPMPIYIQLGSFAAAIEAQPPEERRRYTTAAASLLEWIDETSGKRAGLPAGTLSGAIQQPDGCLLLLDGLDEAGDEGRRAFVAELIGNLAAAHPGHRYVVASRAVGYGGRVRLPDFVERHLSPLDGDEIRGLIARWYTAVGAHLDEAGGGASNAEAQADRLWGAIERSPQLFEMASSPLLATTIALLQLNHVVLPDQRATLYERLVELLLDRWREQRPAGHDGWAGAPGDELHLIERLALQMQQQPGQPREVGLAQAQSWLSPHLAERLQIDRAAAAVRVQALLDSLALSGGLLQLRQGGYSFSHYTFQEYLAACALDAQPGAEDGVAFLLARAGDPRWREILLLAAGHWGNVGQLDKAGRLASELLGSADTSRALLAAEALAAIGPAEELAKARADAVSRLPALAFEPGGAYGPSWRAEVAELLDRLDGDDRPALDPLRPEYWAQRIEPGVFMFAEQVVRRTVIEDGKHVLREEKVPAYSYQIRRPYALARFPVTNRQYLAFLEDLERQGRIEEAGERRPRGWPGRRYHPGSGSHPVAMVTWYDAAAYAFWLNRRLRDQGLLGPGEELRLPTEPEWERAAAYPVAIPEGSPLGSRRAYPWGDWSEAGPAVDTNRAAEGRPDSEQPRANTIELGLGGTSPVGVFPHGAADCGAEELAGNVWEWCSTASQHHPLPDELRIESLDTELGLVMRGGSWLQERDQAQCGARFAFRPGNFAANFGFRLVRLFSTERP